MKFFTEDRKALWLYGAMALRYDYETLSKEKQDRVRALVQNLLQEAFQCLPQWARPEDLLDGIFDDLIEEFALRGLVESLKSMPVYSDYSHEEILDSLPIEELADTIDSFAFLMASALEGALDVKKQREELTRITNAISLEETLDSFDNLNIDGLVEELTKNSTDN